MRVRNEYLEELDQLQQDLMRIGVLTGEAIMKASDCLKTLNGELARQVIHEDDRIDRLVQSVESACVRLIATQQPVAGDLRRIEAANRTAVDLERIADYAEDLARIALNLEGQKLIKPLVDIPRMAQAAFHMLDQAMEAYMAGDTEKARMVAARDDEVDRLYRSIFDELVVLLAEDGSRVPQGMNLLLAGKYMERVGDHITNIAENIIYMVDGERVSLN